VFKATSSVGRGWRWLLDNQLLGDATKTTTWFPKPGKHTLVLQDEDEETIDNVPFEVRGATDKVHQVSY
jgi:hypothetical protein